MRHSGLALATTLALAATTAAQQAPPRLPAGSAAPAAAAPAAPLDPVLEGHLRRWEQEMQRFQTLSLRLSRVDMDKALRAESKFSGVACFMKTGSGPTARNMALVELKPEGSLEVAEKFICTGTYFYLFNPQSKEIQARELPRSGPGGVSDDNFLAMFGLRADEAGRRYNLKLHKPDDPNYVYIEIEPRFQRDREEFEAARIVLNRTNYVPRQIWYRAPDKKEVLWDIPPQTVRLNERLDQRLFDQPATPPGWKLVKVRPETDAQPRTIRNSSNP
jgi:TIGR03009 family protein